MDIWKDSFGTCWGVDGTEDCERRGKAWLFSFVLQGLMFQERRQIGYLCAFRYRHRPLPCGCQEIREPHCSRWFDLPNNPSRIVFRQGLYFSGCYTQLVTLCKFIPVGLEPRLKIRHGVSSQIKPGQGTLDRMDNRKRWADGWWSRNGGRYEVINYYTNVSTRIKARAIELLN